MNKTVITFNEILAGTNNGSKATKILDDPYSDVWLWLGKNTLVIPFNKTFAIDPVLFASERLTTIRWRIFPRCKYSILYQLGQERLFIIFPNPIKDESGDWFDGFEFIDKEIDSSEREWRKRYNITQSWALYLTPKNFQER